MISVIIFLITLVLLLMSIRKIAKQRENVAELREQLAAQKSNVERLPIVEQELKDANLTIQSKNAENFELKGQLETLKNSHQARLEEINGMKKELEEKFANLASGVLKSNSERFLELVSERFQAHKTTAEEDLIKRQTAIQELVKPLSEKLGKFDTRINEIEKARNEAYGAIKAQVLELTKGQQNLGQETRRLVQALRAPKTRGRWGEMQLRQVFELAGMVENVDFVSESSVSTEEGLRRPDAIVKIPGGKSIVIDAKTPLEAYLDALEKPEQQQEHLIRHANQVRQHVKLLASKAYQDAIPTTPDFVVMFIPGETFVSAAAEHDPGLIEYAFERKILIASPTTLMALIKAIAYGWQQEKMAENAAEVQRLAKELYDRLSTFAEHLERVGKSLGQSVDNYNRAVGSLEGRILPSARKFEAMGVVSNQTEIGSPKSIEKETRRLTATEFTKTEGT
ncbi:DNA recombination protein RmuC [Roseovarius sp. A46]|uniref:DNA recombination protein RmuC n=1 Tax=Roseovarius sp. A46 TaxID=2109331 RepID=UPI0010135440|nr:DNA recombination protein RmuC [Roseovarius sp. A46]RXV66837.1 DNA recombination protein RmuC [Roseovarius sp. A46]